MARDDPAMYGSGLVGLTDDTDTQSSFDKDVGSILDENIFHDNALDSG